MISPKFVFGKTFWLIYKFCEGECCCSAEPHELSEVVRCCSSEFEFLDRDACDRFFSFLEETLNVRDHLVCTGTLSRFARAGWLKRLRDRASATVFSFVEIHLMRG